MEQEFEAAGAASIGAVAEPNHPVDSGEPCRNCGVVVPDKYCTNCGQLASNFHRPIWSLVKDGLADTLAIDGRLARTLPALLYFPGRMTREYLGGKRARYVPPFRLFLLASLICFFSYFTASDRMGWFDDVQFGPSPGDEMVVVMEGSEINIVTLKSAAEIEENLALPNLTDEDRAEWMEEAAKRDEHADRPRALLPDGSVNSEAIDAYLAQLEQDGMTPVNIKASRRRLNRAARVYENIGRAGLTLREWLPRIAVLFAPLLALTLGAMYIWRRSIYFYDHIVVAMHFQTFIFLWMTLLLPVELIWPSIPGWLHFILLSLPIPYLYRLLREAYGRGRFTTALRVLVLLVVMPVILVTLISALVSIIYYTV